MTGNKIKVLIVGFGQIGGQNTQDKLTKKTYRFSNHFQAIKASENFELVGIVEKSSKVRELAKNKYKIKNVFSSISEANTKIKKIDLAVISTPPLGRYNLICSFKNIKGLIIEKPISLNIAESKKILNFCKKNKILCEVNYWRRFVPQFLENNEIFDLLGSLQSCVIYYCGGLKNNGVHLIDFVRFKYGEISNLSTINSFRILQKENINGDFNVPFSGYIKKIPIIGLPVKKNFFRENSIELLGTQRKNFFSK